MLQGGDEVSMQRCVCVSAFRDFGLNAAMCRLVVTNTSPFLRESSRTLRLTTQRNNFLIFLFSFPPFYFLPIHNYCRQWNFAVVVRQITLEQDGAEGERTPTARWQPKRSSTRTGHFCRTVGGARSGLRDRSDGDGLERAREGGRPLG